MDTMKERPLPPVEVLNREYASATDEQLQSALKSINFELELRESRREVGRLSKERDTARAAEVAEAIAGIEAQYSPTPYDHERQGL